jgi:hypothetical protein
MSRRRLAFAASPPADGGRQSSGKHTAKKAGGRRDRRQPREVSVRPSLAVFSELEQAFFAAAPPDDPPPAAQPESFDDLGGPGPATTGFRASWDALWASVRRLFVRPAKPLAHRS